MNNKVVARFYFNISRHKGKYGTAVSVYRSKEDRMADYDECSFNRRLDYFKTYRFNEDGMVDTKKQIEYLKKKVLTKYPICVFDNLVNV